MVSSGLHLTRTWKDGREEEEGEERLDGRTRGRTGGSTPPLFALSLLNAIRWDQGFKDSKSRQTPYLLSEAIVAHNLNHGASSQPPRLHSIHPLLHFASS